MTGVSRVGMLDGQQAPPEVLAGLRRIDSKADLIHLGGGQWWLGIRAPNPKAHEQLAHAQLRARGIPTIADPAERAVAQMELAKEFKMRQIMADGFRPVALYDFPGAPDHTVVEDFRIRDFNWRTKTEAQIQRELREHASMDLRNMDRIRRFTELAKEKASEAFRYVFRRARSFLVGAHLES